MTEVLSCCSIRKYRISLSLKTFPFVPSVVVASKAASNSLVTTSLSTTFSLPNHTRVEIFRPPQLCSRVKNTFSGAISHLSIAPIFSYFLLVLVLVLLLYLLLTLDDTFFATKLSLPTVKRVRFPGRFRPFLESVEQFEREEDDADTDEDECMISS